MKKIIKLIVFFSITMMYSQGIKVTYLEKIKRGNDIFTLEGKLLHNINESVYINEEVVLKNEVSKKNNTKTTTVSKSPYQLYFKEYDKDSVYQQIGKVNSLTMISKIKNYGWKLTGEQKNIEGLMCEKAVSEDGKIVAWYTSEIGVKGGPQLYDGLPGLIVFVQTPTTMYVVKDLKRLKNKNVFPPKDKFTKFYTEEELKKGVTTTATKYVEKEQLE